ncbi:DUF4097 family beta strand repeat-containing protein [Oceanobacillus indicireducens]|uniref:DUF4097 domain-containing protein n=1 Tax=Oceanobacillus indicireducens TaxID=1004261 RepID=A0A918D1B8_9BACI|nr:DUF4097 family beta strand repeat-containing protein [Oceanobacillus indicireducens]GGN56054.1 hypothetical protein GCM10007971_15460 [Oceanobacillus indicireducens]
MLNRRRIAFIAIVLLVIGFGGALFTYPSLSAGETVEEERTFTDTISDVVIETDNSTIEIVPTTDNVTKVEFIKDTKNNSRYRYKAEVEDGILQVTIKEKVLQFFSFDFSLKSAVTRVYLPEKDYDSLKAKTANGKVRIENLNSDIISAESTNGKMSLENLNTQTATIQSENGKISAVNISGELKAEVTNGTINVEAKSLDHPVDLESVNGKVNVQVEEEPDNAEIIVEVVNGEAIIFGSSSRHRTFGDGENLIKIQTVNGKVVVDH